MMEDLKVKYLGKCLKVNDVYLETIYIIVERIYVHSENIALEGKGYYYNEKKGLVLKEFETIFSEQELMDYTEILTKEDFLKKLEWFYIADMDRILNNYSSNHGQGNPFL